MRIMIIGQKWLGCQALQLCISRGDDIAAVTAPRIDDSMAILAAERGIPVCQVSGVFDAQWMPDNIDLILCAHAHLFITPQARAKARHGALGYHPSLLPRHRGRDAIHWTLHMRDPITGGTAYWLDDGADTGDIAAQDWCWTKPRDTPLSLWLRELVFRFNKIFT